MSTKTPTGMYLEHPSQAQRWSPQQEARQLGSLASTTALSLEPNYGRQISETEGNRPRSPPLRPLGDIRLRRISAVHGAKTTTPQTRPTCGPARRRSSNGLLAHLSTPNSGECRRRTTGTPGANHLAAETRASTRTAARPTRASSRLIPDTICEVESLADSTATCGASTTSTPAARTR